MRLVLKGLRKVRQGAKSKRRADCAPSFVRLLWFYNGAPGAFSSSSRFIFVGSKVMATIERNSDVFAPARWGEARCEQMTAHVKR